jgi:hypothetical protein
MDAIFLRRLPDGTEEIMVAEAILPAELKKQTQLLGVIN